MAFKMISGVEIPNEWGAYSTQKTDEFELLHRPLWDTQTYTDNATTQLNFFLTQQANTGLGNEVFPLKNSYLLKAIGLYFKDSAGSNNPTGDVTAFASIFNDHVLLTNTGYLEIKINAKGYGPFPAYKLLPGCGLYGLLGASGTTSGSLAIPNYSQLGLPTPESMFTLAIPLVLPMNTGITMTLNWAAAVNLAQGNSTLTMILDGIEARPA